MKYEAADGVRQDYRRAVALYCRAARQGHANAAYHLAWMHMQGHGVAASPSQAAAWFQKGVEHGHDPSARMLEQLVKQHGRAVAKGIGVGACPVLKAPGAAPRPSVTLRSSAALPDVPRKIGTLVRTLAPKYGLDPALVLAVIAAESSFRADAVSRRNARGLMQLIPETARRFGVRNAFDPTDNLRGGMKYLRWLLAYYRGNVTLVLAAYNAGEGSVDRFRGVPPYAETRAYLKKVRLNYALRRHPFEPALTTASAIVGPVEVAERSEGPE